MAPEGVSDVIVSDQPLATEPALPPAKSTTYRFHVPLGSSPTNVDDMLAVALTPPGGAE